MFEFCNIKISDQQFYFENGRYDHPLLVEERERGDWVLPITVNAPPPRNQSAQSKNEKPVSLGN